MNPDECIVCGLSATILRDDGYWYCQVDSDEQDRLIDEREAFNEWWKDT